MKFDMCVTDDVLQVTKERLQKIRESLLASSEQMNYSVQRSSMFLTGKQFERTKSNTEQCVKKTETVGKNLQYAINYINELERLLEEYVNCSYDGYLT